MLELESIEALKQIFKEQEENENATKKAQQELDELKRQTVEARKEAARTRAKIDAVRLATLKAKQEHAKQKQIQAEAQRRTDAKIFIWSIIATFAICFVDLLIFLAVILKY